MSTPSHNEKQPSADLGSLEQSALQQGENLAVNKLEQKAGKETGKVVHTAQQVQQYAGIAQSVFTTPPPEISTRPGFGENIGINANNTAPKNFTISAPDTRGTSADESAEPAAYTCADISVGSYTIKSFESFQLMQSTRTHHHFELVIACDALLDSDGKRVPEDEWLPKSSKLLGEPISIGFYYHVWPDKQRTFKGIITNVGYRRTTYGFGDIVLTGGSPTLLLDSAPHIQSFTGMGLSSIANKLLEQGGVRADGVRPRNYTQPLPYTCQYNETHYNYLARLAAHYGEWFFYDGLQICFGKPEPKPVVKLVLGRNVSSMQGQMNGRHMQPRHYGYNSSKHTSLIPHTYDIKDIEQLGMTALDISRKMYQTPAMQVAPIRAAENRDITVVQKSAATAKAAELFTVEGTTTNPYLFPGCYVALHIRDVSTNKTTHYADLIITELRQTLDYSGAYQAEFTGVPAKTENLPFPHFTMPVAEPQLATVADNSDSQGRVKVKFPWQDAPTDFIRVMTPDAGSSEKASTNRGLVTIPEIGDSVMIGFVHSHPDRPFVMGGMFHGKAGGGGGAGNNVKSLTSKSGHTVRLDDGGGITVMDKEQNVIHLDGAGNISVFSKKSISLCCGSGEEGAAPMSAISLDIDGNISLKAKKIAGLGSELVSMGSGMASGEDLNGSGFSLNPENIGIKAKKDCNIHGDESVDLSSSDKIILQAKGEAFVQGKKVNIN